MLFFIYLHLDILHHHQLKKEGNHRDVTLNNLQPKFEEHNNPTFDHDEDLIDQQ